MTTRSQPGARAASAPLLGHATEPTIFEMSVPGRSAFQLRSTGVPPLSLEDLVPEHHRNGHAIDIAEVSERDLVGHFTRLSHRQFSVDLGMYPLGSCTMKYNPKFCDAVAADPGLNSVHPGAPAELTQGWLELLVSLEEKLCVITGMAEATLQPAAGAAGELTGLLLMRAYHSAQGDARRRVLIPDSAHGTNPASVTLGGYEVTTIPSTSEGLVDLVALKAALGPDVAGIMLTNPNTVGLFEEDILEIAESVHDVGGLLYYDGANLNAILGVVRPGDMGFDIVHMNLHKTFATPHGGGGPGAGPVAVSKRLVEFLPGPKATRLANGTFDWVRPARSIGRVHGWHGNAMVLARALSYIDVHGADGLERVAKHAVLNANWLRHRLRDTLPAAYDRTCMHECVLTATPLKTRFGVRGLDVAKALLEEGFHSPTVYFPLIVDEAMMFEPTETESVQTMEALAEAIERIAQRAIDDPQSLHRAPQTTPVSRVDEARAARHLIATEDAAQRMSL
ncbi:MAG: aminomethyl-transferring glycine dehydrogenase subunit GcvPB [Acidimicrobiaceae bacterium]|nr:aminomethyl-transferring glycine dehydrogenase subunit GcvPB [Acidimicrobiaceae bacterium]